MHLRRILIYGFKSFANETRIELPAGLTALVGPNGGGKSNVVDAVRWALGEHRLKELRAERWEDLLYAGGSRKRPAQVAEVILEFDNADGRMAEWPEALTVGRRLLRSGDAAFLINGRDVRLKDITDLFLDSGLGGRAAYAVIGQGKVESALLQRPHDRLEQLEEAAGTTRYKVRRRETEQHLHGVVGELQRVADLRAEVARELTAIEERANNERQYLAWEGEMRTLRQGLRAAKRLEATRRVEEFQRQIEALTAEGAGIQSQLGTVVEAIDALQATRPEDADELKRLMDESLAREREQERWLGRQESLRGRLAHLTALAERGRQAVEQSTAALDRLQASLETPEDAREHLRVETAAVAARVTELESALAETEHALRQAEAVREERRRQEVLQERASAELERLLSSSTEQIERGHGPETVLRILSARRDTAQARLVAIDGEEKVGREEAQRLNRSLQTLREELSSLTQRVVHQAARLRALEQLEADGEGYGQGVRAVLRGQAEGQLQGILGTLGTLVQVQAPHQMAIQAALGGAQQDLVVESEQHARTAVRFLQDHRLGRATFLPLDTIKPSRPQGDDRPIEHQAGVVGWALDLVEVEDRIRPAVAHALGRVLVLRRLEDAVEVGRQLGFRYRLVTLDGQLIHPGGAITGGSLAPQNTTWKRKQEIVELARDTAAGRDRQQRLEEQIAAAAQEAAQREQAQEALREERRAVQERLAEALRVVQGLEQLMGSGLAQTDPAAVRATRLAAEEAVRRLEADRDGLKDQLQVARGAAEQTAAALRHQEWLWAEFTRRSEERASQLRHEEERVVQARTAEMELAREMQTARQELEQAEASVVALGAQLTELNQQIAELRASEADTEEDLRALSERQRVLELEARRLDQRTQHVALELERQRGQLAELETGAAAEGDPVPDIRAAERRLSLLADAMQEMGPIVPGSLAMYNALTERAEFLDRECRDIEEAAAELRATISELDREVEERRRATASQVEAAFAEAVRELFGGGAGGFRWLTDPEPGLELWVQPSGKRPQSLQLLSGGEKALGALAWLFALLEVRPSPLVVLDEVEASLDELNARRFAQYLARRRHSQYLVVTHHKPTMEHADALWGFTSDGAGTSRLVSVRLGAGESGREGEVG